VLDLFALFLDLFNNGATMALPQSQTGRHAIRARIVLLSHKVCDASV